MGTAKRERQKAGRQARLQELEQQQRKSKNKNLAVRVAAIAGGFVVVVFIMTRLIGGGGSSSTAATSTTVDPNAPTTVQPAFVYGTADCPPTGNATRKADFTAAPKLCIDPAKTYTATFDTTEGKIVVKLDATRTPGTTNNFVTLARWKFYDTTPFFRTDPSIDIIQGGGTSASDQIGYTIPDEGGKFTYSTGDLTMARSGAPNSAGAQFFFATGPKVSNLDAQGTYVTFGKVTEGQDVLSKVMGLHKADSSGLGGAPSRTVTVNSVTITES